MTKPIQMKNLLRRLFFSTNLWFFAFGISIAQAPAADLDSITEDAYRRMLERQVTERESDTLLTNQSESVLTKVESKKPEWIYLMSIFIIVGIGLVYWHNRRTSKGIHLKK